MRGVAPAPHQTFLKESLDQRTLLTNFLVQICLDGYSQRHLYNPRGSLTHSVIRLKKENFRHGGNQQSFSIINSQFSILNYPA